MITKFLLEHKALNPVSFHMPGHKGDRLYRKYGYDDFLDNIFNCDITEIPGADNLFQTEGIIKRTMEKYARLYEVSQSYLLINGTSGGIIASILGTVSKGGKLIMARNCHKSVFNAIRMGEISPIYAYPDIVEEYGIAGRVSVEEIENRIKENLDAEAVILPSPNYYGICSDIRAIAEVCHRYNKILIVDQAHGAHLKFFSSYAKNNNSPASAEECGSDIVINSTHKTLASLTQSAVLNVNGARVNRYELEDKLQMIESTSPSYVLMASLDINADIIEKHGFELINRWQENIDGFYSRAKQIPGLKIMETEGLDRTKINIDFGIEGSILEKKLIEKGIFPELSTGNIVMAMSGIGNDKNDYERVLDALRDMDIDKRSSKIESMDNEWSYLWSKKRPLCSIPKKKTRVPLEKAAGKVCASSLIPYPPGIPLVCPGEEISEEDILYVKHLRNIGEKVIGINDLGEVTIGGDK